MRSVALTITMMSLPFGDFEVIIGVSDFDAFESPSVSRRVNYSPGRR
jgi:hypothetical protein